MKRKGNLSEELYKMRKLMTFNSEKFRDETTSLDRLVEEKMIEKYLLNEQYKYDPYPDEKIRLRNVAQTNYYHYFTVVPKDNVVKADVEDINALFYNNMVTLEKGLMPDTPIESVREQIKNIIVKLKEEGYDEKSLKINIIGTASSAAASEFADERLGKELPVDHRGADYGGEKPNNEYLAKERAKSIYSVFKKLLPGATYTTTSKVLEGGEGPKGDTVRFIKLDITGSKTIKKQVTTSDSYLNFKYTYKEGEGYTTMEALQQQKGEELTNQQGAVFSGGPFKTYTAKLEISFGSKIPSYGGKYIMGSADNDIPRAEEGVDVYKHSLLNDQQRVMGKFDETGERALGWDNIVTSTLKAKGKLFGFLRTSGHFTIDQVNTILAGFKDPNSPVLDKLKDKEGNFKDFVSLMGGKSEQTIDSDYAKFAIVDDTVTRKIKQIR